MKERFLCRILLPNPLPEFGVTEEVLLWASEEIREDISMEEKGRVKQLYTLAEDNDIIQFISSENRFHRAKGNNVWKLLASQHEDRGKRSWSSLRNRYLKVILRDLLV